MDLNWTRFHHQISIPFYVNNQSLFWKAENQIFQTDCKGRKTDKPRLITKIGYHFFSIFHSKKNRGENERKPLENSVIKIVYHNKVYNIRLCYFLKKIHKSANKIKLRSFKETERKKKKKKNYI